MSTRCWEDGQRLEAWAGETRVNLIRAAALVAFYAHHLFNVYIYANDSTLRGKFHILVTGVVLAWGAAIFLIYYCLSRRIVPPALKYVATLWDLAMISALLVIGGKGPVSPLIFLYFLVVAAAPLRLSLHLVYVATFGAMAAATLVMGHYVFIQTGYGTYYHSEFGGRVPRSHEIIFLLSIAAAGLLAGQAVRQARRLVEGYSVHVDEKREAA
jgi:hypothetical protein